MIFPIRAFIFDLDGVLTDTAEYHYRAWQRLADEEGYPFNREINEQLRGVSRRRSLEIIIGDREVEPDRFEAMMARKNEYYVGMLDQITPNDLLPGALELLNELKAAGMKIALASASKNARTVIERLGITPLLDAVADGYSVERSKPAPDLFLFAARELGVDPGQCVVVEDAAAGIEAALAAGMWAVGLGPAERVGNAHVRFESLEGVRLAGLLAAGPPPLAVRRRGAAPLAVQAGLRAGGAPAAARRAGRGPGADGGRGAGAGGAARRHAGRRLPDPGGAPRGARAERPLARRDRLAADRPGDRPPDAGRPRRERAVSTRDGRGRAAGRAVPVKSRALCLIPR